ncbi:ABC transporter permease [Leuconostoc miyukkimchii]|mgnify:CR=1 FL=1|uniref:ABC transporter permease n=1 Tax=Leuconostoc miyukkimchii TaxID=910540 RepID=UPI001C7D1EEE|nr:ABC transporter permease [Leuconostoc miyukkimchii]
MISLVSCEFKKLKRNSILKYTVLAAFLFPVPLSILALHANMSFDKLKMFVFIFGFYLLMPIFMGLILATLIFEERDNNTLKNILTIPISKKRLLLAKIVIALIIGLLFSIVSLILPIVLGIVRGNINIEQLVSTVCLGLIIGIMVTVAALPLLIVVLKIKNNYLMSFVVSLAYTVLSFVISLQYNRFPLPLSVVFKWSLPHISSGTMSPSITRLFFSTTSCIGILCIVGILSYFVTVKLFESEAE